MCTDADLMMAMMAMMAMMTTLMMTMIMMMIMIMTMMIIQNEEWQGVGGSGLRARRLPAAW